MGYEYKFDDMFYDVESLDNVFTVAWWLPKANAMILSYLDDDNIIKGHEDEAYIRERMYELHPRLKRNQTQIMFENIKHTGFISEFNADPTANLGQLGMQSFAKRLGLAHIDNYLNQPIDSRSQASLDGTQFHEAYYPVKQTDPDYDENRHGYRFGYNSTNYDMTMLAWLLTNIPPETFAPQGVNQPILFQGRPITARDLRMFNDELFEKEWINSMSRRLTQERASDYDRRGNFRSAGWIQHKAWLLTGRYIDVSRLNEALQKVGLKRLLGMLGLHIMESDKLDGTNAHIQTLDEMADLLAYNISDVINLQILFEHPVYVNSFELRGSLLESYPMTIYDQKKGVQMPNGQEAPADEGNYLNIRRDRLTRDSTSAKFAEVAIAPYSPLSDFPTVSFMYPSDTEVKRLQAEVEKERKETGDMSIPDIVQKDILEETRKFFEENVTNDPNTQAHKDFMDVYNFYASIRGRNFNPSNKYIQDNGINGMLPDELQPKNGEYIRDLMRKYNTNLFYFYREPNGHVRNTSCMANFSIGGIHGAEVNVERINQDYAEYNQERIVLDYVKSMYNHDVLEAINGDTYIEIPEEVFEQAGGVPERLKNKAHKETGEYKIRDFMKGGSTRKKAEWREVKPVEIFKLDARSWKLVDRYRYVSVGYAHHEDFESYYPLLLSRLSAFVNPSYHGYDENGDAVDPYYGMYADRAVMKARARDKSLDEAVRALADLIQNQRKLLINAASGYGDAPFENNIRVNNAVMSMRIIGQLFAWRIGQAQSLAGARVPSTNTDGLYIMDIPAEVNDRILEDTARDMYVKIEPERLERFVSKDSNSRLEVAEGGRITSASGGTLNSWKGPQPTKSLDHPAITDYMLAMYLADSSIENPADVPFDRDRAREMYYDFIESRMKDKKYEEILLYFQWILASSPGTHRFIYAKHVNDNTGQVSYQQLQQYNRAYLLKQTTPNRQELYLATKRAINPSTWKKRQQAYEAGECYLKDLWQHDEVALDMLKRNGFDLEQEQKQTGSEFYRHSALTMVVRSMPKEQHTRIYNYSIKQDEIDPSVALSIIQNLDIDAYLEMLEKTFKSWSNLE